MNFKHPKADLKRRYILTFQFSLILSLLFLLALTKMELNSDADLSYMFQPDELDVSIELPPQIPPKTPPAPIKPWMPAEVPNDTPIEIEVNIPNLEIDSFLYEVPAQPSNNNDENQIFDSFGIEILPQMQGGLQKLYANIEYPEVARKAGIQGLVTIQFIVNKEGDVEDPTILRGIGGGCDEEVLRVIKLMKFSPGVQNGRIVNVKMAQSVRFELNN